MRLRDGNARQKRQARMTLSAVSAVVSRNARARIHHVADCHCCRRASACPPICRVMLQFAYDAPTGASLRDDTNPRMIVAVIRDFVSMPVPRTQREIARALLEAQGIVRLSEFRDAGITAATVSRMERAGEVLRLDRGLYQLPDAALDANHTLAEVAKRLPKGVVCLVSALAYHGLTDRLPSKVWMAIGVKDWAPTAGDTPLRIVRFTESLLTQGVESHVIEGVPVKVFGVAKTIADCFRHRNKVGIPVAIQGLQEALHQRKATPGAIAREAERGGVATVIRPYLAALTANG
ncbi:type IV toxin-antitoxin system AbiEi family antitoxin domain-containing protein [Trinickia symbiotica]|nr:type IV toxin-antitoxin system AbiEi family antitoxin domain-containing protein [Trinickia symbiotica]